MNSTPLPTNRSAAPESRDASDPGYLAWLEAITPGKGAKQEVEWRLMEAERFDDQMLEALSREHTGY